MRMSRHKLGRPVGVRTGVEVLQPLQDDFIAALDGDVQAAAGRAGRRGVWRLEVGAAVHAVPPRGDDDHFGGGTFRRAAQCGDLKGLLESVGHYPVDSTDADANPGDGAARGAPLDRLKDTFAVAHFVHLGLPYIDRMRR